MESHPGEITLLLTKWNDGEPGAFDALVPLVYPRLRELAASYIRRERSPGVMQASLWCTSSTWVCSARRRPDGDRTHFYTFSAKIMRMILIDHARSSQAQRRGGGVEHLPLNDDIAWVGIGSAEMVELNQALDALALIDAAKVQLVELRYFLGRTAEETATLLNVSKATVDRDLKFTRSWLFRWIRGDAAAGPAKP